MMTYATYMKPLSRTEADEIDDEAHAHPKDNHTLLPLEWFVSFTELHGTFNWRKYSPSVAQVDCRPTP
jgi:hypothetical protein